MARIEAGDQIIESTFIHRLWQLKEPLSPSVLAEVDSDFAQFQPLYPGSQVYLPKHKRDALFTQQGRQKKIVCSLSGSPAGGKDEARNYLDLNYPGLTTKIVTATSRGIRVDQDGQPIETNGVDYFFYSPEQFLEMVDAKTLIEYSRQADKVYYYGMPISSIQAAINHQAPIAVSHLEISGWPKLAAKSELISTTPPLILSLYVLPQLRVQDYFRDWLPQERPQNWQAKAKRFAWEMSQLAQVADAIIVNPIDKDHKDEKIACFSSDIANFLFSFLRPDIQTQLTRQWSQG